MLDFENLRREWLSEQERLKVICEEVENTREYLDELVRRQKLCESFVHSLATTMRYADSCAWRDVMGIDNRLPADKKEPVFDREISQEGQ